MSNARIRANDDAWANGVAIAPAELRAFDENTAGSLNGDAGGLFGTSADFEVGGAGMRCLAPWRIGGANYLPGLVRTPSGSGKRIVHGDNDYVTWPAGHINGTATIRVAGTEAIDTSRGRARFARYESDDTVRNYVAGAVTYRAGGRLLVPLHVVHGGRIAGVVFRFIVGASHSSVPAVLPLFRAKKVSADGVETALATSGILDGGWKAFAPTPGSGALWYAAAAIQSMSYDTDNDATCVADIGAFTYWAEMVDESGTGALGGNRLVDVRAVHENILDARPQ